MALIPLFSLFLSGRLRQVSLYSGEAGSIEICCFIRFSTDLAMIERLKSLHSVSENIFPPIEEEVFITFFLEKKH